MLEKLREMLGLGGSSKPEAPVRQPDEVPAPVAPNDSTASETMPAGERHPAPEDVQTPPSPEAFGQRGPEEDRAG